MNSPAPGSQLLAPRSAVPVSIFPSGEEVQVAPGVMHMDLPPDLAPRLGLVRWMPNGDGTFRPRLQVMETWVRVRATEVFGYHIKWDTLVRLGTAGFIQLSKPSPGCIMVNIDSLRAHMEACRDPEFWTPERVRKYKTALPTFED